MKVLLLGGGGREHAIGWKLARSPLLECLIVAPGNPGLSDVAALVPDLDINDPEAVLHLALANSVDLVVVGPEAPLAAGVTDTLTGAGLAVCGPTRAGARLEASKKYAKDVMARAGVPTAAAEAFTGVDAACAHLEQTDGPYVVKADGLAAGKGVLVTDDLDAARRWARFCIEGGFGEAGRTVIVERHLDGHEVSVFAICDGTRAIALAPARDYKRLRDGDLGPNTGGMGCISPPPALETGLVESTMDRVIAPVLDVLSSDGVPYRGFLYAGLMVGSEGAVVLEFNCRLGDPETQALLPLLDSDLLPLLTQAAAGDLTTAGVEWRDATAVDVVLAAEGYPEQPQRGGWIKGTDTADALDDVHVFHAGTRRTPEGLVTAGGRVLNVVGIGADAARARARAYEGVATIHFDGMQFRTDIAG
ncbi:MAG: phosphoribosylamine--glycine ligase [Acidimicrobiia bacterium]